MRKFVILSSLLVFLLIYFSSTGEDENGNKAILGPVSAQEVNESTAEPDLVSEIVAREMATNNEYEEKFRKYNQNIEDYRRAHDVYKVTRAQYIRSKTQKAKTDAKEATIELLQLRDDVVISYLDLLKAKLNETEGVSDARYEGLEFEINEEIFWYEKHRGLISSAGSLDDLVEDSDDAKDRKKLTERLYYETLSNISYGKITHYRDRVKENLEELRGKVDEVRVDERVGYSFSGKKMQVLDRWIFEADNLLLRTQDKQSEADDEINDMVENRFQQNKTKSYNEVMEILSEGKQFLKEASSYLVEVIKEIKIAEY